jgi:Mor family transcriptional regulator
VKKTVFQQGEMDLLPSDQLEEIQRVILLVKEDAADLGKRIKEQGAAFREVAVLLGELRTALLEMSQGELFNDESTETFEQLRDIIGEEQASRVAKAFAGTMVYIPKNVIAKNLHKKINKEFWDGATYKELSRKYGYTERYIRNLVDRKKEYQHDQA